LPWESVLVEPLFGRKPREIKGLRGFLKVMRSQVFYHTASGRLLRRQAAVRAAAGKPLA